jgi:hypothetical protein
LNREYVGGRIKTVLLNGRPVDDLGSAMVDDGSTLALSAAMPGLVGATMRRDGLLAPFRNTIAHQELQTQGPAGDGWIVLKLFNLLIAELGPTFLERGIWIETEALEQLFQAKAAEVRRTCSVALLNGKEEKVDNLLERIQSGSHAWVKLKIRDES